MVNLVKHANGGIVVFHIPVGGDDDCGISVFSSFPVMVVVVIV